MTYHDQHDPELHDETIPPAAQRYMAVWIALAIVLLPLLAWAALYTSIGLVLALAAMRLLG